MWNHYVLYLSFFLFFSNNFDDRKWMNVMLLLIRKLTQYDRRQASYDWTGGAILLWIYYMLDFIFCLSVFVYMLYGFINFMYRRMNVIPFVWTVSLLTVHPYVYEWESVSSPSPSKWLRMTLNYDLLYEVFDYIHFFDIPSIH